MDAQSTASFSGRQLLSDALQYTSNKGHSCRASRRIFSVQVTSACIQGVGSDGQSTESQHDIELAF